MKTARLLILFLVPAAVALGVVRPASPAVTLRINGHADAPESLELGRGEPVIAEIILRNSVPAGQAFVLLDPPDGGWASRLKIEVASNSGAKILCRFILAGKTSGGSLSLQPGSITTVVFRMDPASISTIVSGHYRFTAQLSLPDGRGWRGIEESEPVEVQVVEPPVNPSGAILGQRQLLRVRDALLAGDLPRAETAATEMLRADLDRSEGFVAKALIAEARGERRLALAAIDLAMAHAAELPAFMQWPGTTVREPKVVPLSYEDLRRRFEQMPSTDPEPAPLPGYPDHVSPVEKTQVVQSATPIINPDDRKFPLDLHGRWAAGGEASSELGTPKFSARQALGPPNVTNYGHHGEAWSPKPGGEAWLKLTFNTATRISAVRTRQTFNPGAMVKIEAYAADGRTAVVWSGHDATVYPPNQIAWFVANFPPTAFPIQTIKLTFDSTALPGPDEIDAVQIITEP